MKNFPYLLVLLVCFLCCAVLPSTAIHEDEQGLRDWILRFVGHVEHAVLHPGLKMNQVYVTSSQGAVAALALGDGGLQWRTLFSESQACIAASKRGVVVSSHSGTVQLLDAATGTIETTYKLLLPKGAKVMTCTFVGENMKFAAMSSSTAFLYSIEAKTDDEEIKASKEFPIPNDTHNLNLGGSYLWVLRPSGIERYSLSGEKDITGVDGGNSMMVSNSGEAVILSETKVTVVGDAGKTKGIECSNCGAAMLVNPFGKFEGYVTTQTGVRNFTVSFPQSKVTISDKSGLTSVAAPTILIAVLDSQYGAWVILRSINGHLLAVSERSGAVWKRMEGLAEIAHTVIADNPVHDDHFSFSKLALAISEYGVLYAIPLAEKGQNIRVLVDVSETILSLTDAPSMKDVKIEEFILSGTNIVTVIASFGTTQVTISINTGTGAVLETKKHEEVLVVTPTFGVTHSLKVHGTVPFPELYVFSLNVTDGLIEGYLVSPSSDALPLWTVRMPFPVVAYATGEDALRTSVVNNLRVFPNVSSKTDEVRRKYPTRHVLVVAHYEPTEDELSTLVVTAIDTVTGSVLATVRHRNVAGRVSMAVVEHAVVYYFLDAAAVRHCVGVWELFEAAAGPPLRRDAGATLPLVAASFVPAARRAFTARAARPPTVAVAVRGIHGGDLAAMGVTTSYGAIARKAIILAFESGRVAAVELRRVLTNPNANDENSNNNAKLKLPLTHVIIDSTMLLTHKYRLARPTRIATAPTGLESSCHVMVSGLDLFYVRASSGKAFDLLNSDFNKSLLVTLTCSFGVLSLVARYFVRRKGLNLLWR
ncbi:Pyrrolo-quinoline quinone repeat [Trypanosoma melophagium]|uniref:Pyrrolo-quinoline quinone repeat n=1 Tax=Trypanosoma melophagium TaxID=715481 RepID=UPI00351A7E6B|nr:Pyrrolo-quinoline quinone repeat [Trypanosoma melophagium]